MQIEKHVRWLWRFIMMPILFGLIGNAMRFNTLQKNSIAKACGIIVAGPSPSHFLGSCLCSTPVQRMLVLRLASHAPSIDWSSYDS